MKSPDNAVIRLRIDPDFKAEIEEVAKSRKISVSALVRQTLADAVERHRQRQFRASVTPDEASPDADLSHRKVVKAPDQAVGKEAA